MTHEQQEVLVSGPMPVTQGRDNVAGRQTSTRKLNGQFFTPPTTAAQMVDEVAWPRGQGVLLDPCCGDGVYLEAAVRKLLRSDLSSAERRRAISERLWGWDVDSAALQDCSQRLRPLLDAAGLGDVEVCLEHRDALLGLRPGEVIHHTVTNPPYLEAKRMPEDLKDRVREHCPTAARGAFDLYGAFVELAASWARASGGEFSVLIPNRFLVVAYATRLRELLLSGWALRVSDLSKACVFEDAAVYPIILHATPSLEPSYQVCVAGGEHVTIAPDTIRDRLGGMMPLAPVSSQGRRLFERCIQDTECRPLSEVSEIRWTVSFHRSGLRDQFVFDERPDSPHARRFLGGARYAGNSEVGHFRVDWAGSWIDYDEERARAEGNPFPLGAVHASPKLVICQNVRRARAAIDDEGFILKDTLLSLRLRAGQPADLLPWLALILNSNVFHFLYEHAYGGTRKGGAYLHFLPRYLLPFPVPPPPSLDHARELYGLLASSAGRLDDAEFQRLHRSAEELVRTAWKVTQGEGEALDAYAVPAPRMQGRRAAGL
jgi:hypothetical protein